MSGILMAPFFASGEEPVGQQVWTNPSNGAAGTASFTVPDGVTSIWALVVGPGYGNPGDTNIKRGTTILLAADSTLGGGVGGGNGGTGNGFGGGGAGGYSGNGGNQGQSGSGGGGAGGPFAGSGGGVGLLGEGPSGVAGSDAALRNGSVQFGNAAYGGSSSSGNGGNLRYTQLTVIPGQTLTINIGYAGTTTQLLWGAARLMWGGGRSYPNNAGNL